MELFDLFGYFQDIFVMFSYFAFLFLFLGVASFPWCAAQV